MTHQESLYFQQMERVKECPQGHAYEGTNLYITPMGYRGCNTCRKNYGHIRRTIYREGDMDIAAHLIGERDGWDCKLCGKSVDPLLAWPSPMMASVDHIVPVNPKTHKG